ncbi:MAG: HAMP domain-containing histidine kinase [Isosphaeraceae bacterium]|nr:HAMP domain-containing histidine kinase [Isosphaeraceae bacterium]
MAKPLDSRFLHLIVHDLRNPLNVIGLSLRILDEALPAGDAEAREDLDIIRENVAQLERMLTLLADFSRMLEAEPRLDVTPFDPRRLLSEEVEAFSPRPDHGAPPIALEIAATCPAEVALDVGRARQAIRCALINALSAAQGAPIRVASRGQDDRWITEVIVDRPPVEGIEPLRLRPDGYERLLGNERERRGLELALAAHISELFAGSARLTVEPGRRSAILLDWPIRFAPT